MFAKLKHLAIISDNYALLSRFYEALFGMKTGNSPRPESAVAIGDGYVGMNIIPQKLGRQGVTAGDVEDADVIAVHQEGAQSCVQVFFLRAGQNWGNRAYFPRHDSTQ